MQVRRTTTMMATSLLCLMLVFAAAFVGADAAPITGTVKAVDLRNKTLTVEAAERGKIRRVIIEVPPATKIVRVARGADDKPSGEQAATLEEIQPGWTVTVKTKHQGHREIADSVRIVHEP